MTNIKQIMIKVKYGYGAMDYVVLDNLDDVARAYYAKLEHIPVSLGGKVISGQEIKTIEEDIHSYTGWHRSYTPVTADDFAQIKRDVPQEIPQLIELTAKRVEKRLAESQQSLIGTEGLTPELLLTGAK